MKGRTVIVTTIAGCVGIAAAHAQYLGLRLSEEGLGFETLRPDSAFTGWRNIRLDGPAPGQTNEPVSYGRMSETLSSGGQERSGGIYSPLSDRLSSLVETSYATHGSVATEWSVLGQVGAQLGNGWGVQAGMRHSEMGLVPGGMQPYAASAGMADLGSVTVERYWDRYRGAYTLFGSRADTGALGAGHRVEVSYFYTQRSSVGLAYTNVRQFDGAPYVSEFNPIFGTNYSVAGEHWLSETWSINYRALVPDLSTTSGLKPQVRFGLRYTF